MKTARYSASRQKACQSCSNAKAKCDRKAGSCSRCTLRALSCVYPSPQSSIPGDVVQNMDATGEAWVGSQVSISKAIPRDDLVFCGPDGASELPAAGRRVSSPAVESTVRNSPASSSSMTVTEALHLGNLTPNAGHRHRGQMEEREAGNFSGRGLLCPINVDSISIRWMNPYIPVPGQTIKAYPPTIIAFIYRVLKSYASIAVRGRGIPPFVHSSQVTATSSSPPIATCLSLVRICDTSLPGSDDVAADVLMREMNNLYERREAYDDDMASLAAFQAYLIYSMVLFFRLQRGADPFLRQAVMALQEIACSSSRRGLLCPAEQQRARPRWEAWIVAEAKRRTLFTMYLFDSVLSARDGLPTFLGTELRGLLAPSDKALWQAGARYDWETSYNVHLVDWVEGALRIDELWPIPADLDEASVVKRRGRVDQWLENVDEFGTMIYAVTSCTHGG